MHYRLMSSHRDPLIPEILSVYALPSVAQYISIDQGNYWDYVTGTDNVWFYTVLEHDRLIATLHLELSDRVLLMDIVVFPEFQNRGIGTTLLTDIQNGILEIPFDKIRVSIDERNTPSIKLFEKAGFARVSKEDELFGYEYAK